MTVDKNKLFLYVLIFCFFYLFSEGSWFLSEYLNINKYFVLTLFGLIFTGLSYLLINSDLNKTQKDNFHFQLTPEKNCDGGAYMYTSNPIKQKLCNSFSPSDLAKYECCPGQHGRPIWWARSDESNADWANTMCDSGLDDFKPHVL
jgi:hypothetical protein